MHFSRPPGGLKSKAQTKTKPRRMCTLSAPQDEQQQQNPVLCVPFPAPNLGLAINQIFKQR